MRVWSVRESAGAGSECPCRKSASDLHSVAVEQAGHTPNEERQAPAPRSGGAAGPQGEPEPEAQNRPRARPLAPGVISGAVRRFDSTLDKTLRSAVVPYGYTVTTWAGGAYLVSRRGAPSALEAFGFVCGAIAAFALLATISARRSGSGALMSSEPLPIHPDSTHPIFAAGIHVAAVGLALGAATVVDSLFGNAAWLLNSFTVTLIYLSLSSFELAIAIEVHRRHVGRERARVVRDAVRRR